MKVPAETFYGVSGEGRKEIERMLKQRVKVRSSLHYRQLVAALWDLPHREERYLAISLARMFRAHINRDALPLYERMIREGAWWDLVDPVAVWLFGGVWQAERAAVSRIADRYIKDDHLWIRRTALTGQLKHKEATDTKRLYRYCLRCAPETEFFMRKAIGTALREHARTDPDGVRAFLVEHRSALSGLSFREAARHLRKDGPL